MAADRQQHGTPDTHLSPVAAMAIHRRVVPAIPGCYHGDQPRFDRDMQLLQVRREILERTVAIRESQALMVIHRADAADRWERLGHYPHAPATDAATRDLTPAQRRRLTGQAMLAMARAEGLQERIQQLEMEIMAFAATLSDDRGAPHTNGG